MGILRLILAFLRAAFGSSAALAAENLALRQQLAVLQRTTKRPKLRKRDRIFWVWLSKLWPGWRSALTIVQPATVLRWHRRGFKLYWRWRSRLKAGRPPISREMQDLIRKLSRENPLWGAGQIRDNLLRLRYDPPCEDTIRKYMVKPKKPWERSTTWLPFLRNHLDVSWAIDFFTVTTVRFARLYVFVVLDHGRRRAVHFAITCRPSMGWVIQQLREAMPYG